MVTKEELADLRNWYFADGNHGMATMHTQKIKELLDEIECLQKMAEYADHKTMCDVYTSRTKKELEESAPPHACDCGFDEVMK